MIEGKCVRLSQGDYGSKREYGDPLDMAMKFEDHGIRRLHLVDLDKEKKKLQKELLKLKAQNTRLSRTTAKLLSGFSGNLAVSGIVDKDEFYLEQQLLMLQQSLDYLRRECGAGLKN